MDKQKIFKIIFPVLLFLLVLLDGQISRSLRSVMTNQAFLNSHILLMALILAGLWYPKRYLVLSSIFIGLFFDLYYYGIIGINMVVLPLTVFLAYAIYKYVPVNMISIALGLIVFITIMDSSAYLLQVIFNLRSPGMVRFVASNLGPTLMFNIIIYLVLGWPIKKFLYKTNM